MSEEQLGRLANFIKNRIKSLAKNPEDLLRIQRAIDVGLEDFFSTETLRIHEGIDVEKLCDSLEQHTTIFIAQVNRLEEILEKQTSENGEVTTASRRFGKHYMAWTTHRTVRSQGRLTVGECFEEGTVLNVTPLFDNANRRGPVQGLILMRRRY